MTNGLSAINKEPSEEMKDIWKKNGSLSDYQSKPIKRNKPTNDREILDLINSKFL